MIFSPHAWTWIATELVAQRRALRWQSEILQALATDLPAIADALGTLTNTLEGLRMATDDLSTAVTRNEAATGAAVDAINTEIQQLKDAVGQLAGIPDAAAAAARISASAQRLEAATAALAADDPSPTPTPTPTPGPVAPPVATPGAPAEPAPPVAAPVPLNPTTGMPAEGHQHTP